jgi:hypothetical protein
MSITGKISRSLLGSTAATPVVDDSATPLKPITVTVPTACAVSGLGPTTIWALVKEKKLDTVKIGRRTLVTWNSLERLLTPEPKADEA